MKRLLLLSLLFVGIFGSLSAQIKQDRTVGAFSKIKVQSAIKLIITIGNTNKVTVEAEEKVIDKITTEVKNDELKVYSKEGYQTEKYVVVHITVPSLSAIHASGASFVEATTPIPSKSLKIDISGASSLKLDIKTDDLSLMLSGASVASFSGSASRLSASVSGASSLKAAELASNTVEVSVSGASSAKINAKEVLKATANGASSIRYSGDPKDKSVDVSGASSVKKA